MKKHSAIINPLNKLFFWIVLIMLSCELHPCLANPMIKYPFQSYITSFKL